MTNHLTLSNLGWQTFFQQQLSLDEWELLAPARVFECHRSEIEVVGENQKITLPRYKLAKSIGDSFGYRNYTICK